MNDPERRVPRYDRDPLDKKYCSYCHLLETEDFKPCDQIAVARVCKWYLANANETVNHPKHYGGDTTYETIKVLESWLSTEQFQGFLIGNAMKYQSRYRHKGGVEDLKKAKWYLDKYLEKFGDQ